MRIAVLEDDEIQSELYKLWLEKGNDCSFFASVADFLAGLQVSKFDLLLVDLGLPDGSGEEAVAWVRERLGWKIPLIVVTGRDSEREVVRTLKLGADDYVIKPPKPAELLARIEGLARRNGPAQPRLLALGHYTIDLDNREIRAGSEPVELTQKEFELACYLLRNPGRLLSRAHLLQAIWGAQAGTDARTVDAHVSRVRRKLRINPDAGWTVTSVYGLGYRVERVHPAAR